MEPARNGRDDCVGLSLTGRPLDAAMEPARNGRDDSQPSWSYPSRSQPPQWSPPVMGGMTYRPIAVASVPERPQWSPPVMGGMTAYLASRAEGDYRAAMEPARNGRDDRHGPSRLG